MKKKETFWELLQRLDEEAAQFNMHLSEANRYFDAAAKETKKVLEKEQRQLHRTIQKVKAALRKVKKEKGKKNEKES